MRTTFQEQLAALAVGVADLCDLSGQALRQATYALLQADLTVAEDVVGLHDEIAARGSQLEADAIAVLGLQSPGAGDLRAVVGALKNAADTERMGALALHVAKIARRRHPASAVPGEVNGFFADMGRIAVRIGSDAKDIVLYCDPDKAAQLSLDNDAMDDLHRHLFNIVANTSWPHGTGTAVDVTLLSRCYERFADHAVDIARRVIYQSTGILG